MRLLLDTHVLLWWLADDSGLGRSARQIIATGETAFISVVSLWEIAIKRRLGKLEVDFAELLGALPRNGFGLLPIEPHHLLTLDGLPMHHRDPFDRMLVAQSLADGLSLVSADEALRPYGAALINADA